MGVAQNLHRWDYSAVMGGERVGRVWHSTAQHSTAQKGIIVLVNVKERMLTMPVISFFWEGQVSVTP
jgi:hypothetical protein